MISNECPKCGEVKEVKSPGLFACRNCNHHFYIGMEKTEPKESFAHYFLILIFCFISVLIIISNINPIVSVFTALAYYAAFGYFIVFNIIRDKLAIDVAELLRVSTLSLLVAVGLFESLF